MSIFSNIHADFAFVPAALPSDDYADETAYGTDFSHIFEFDVQETADTENEFPAIAQGYPISGFKSVIKRNKMR